MKFHIASAFVLVLAMANTSFAALEMTIVRVSDTVADILVTGTSEIARQGGVRSSRLRTSVGVFGTAEQNQDLFDSDFDNPTLPIGNWSNLVNGPGATIQMRIPGVESTEFGVTNFADSMSPPNSGQPGNFGGFSTPVNGRILQVDFNDLFDTGDVFDSSIRAELTSGQWAPVGSSGILGLGNTNSGAIAFEENVGTWTIVGETTGTVIPEPSSLAIFGLVAGVVAARRRK